MRFSKSRSIRRFAVVLLSLIGSTLLAFVIEPHLHREAPLLPFTIAIVISAWYGGMIPALTATLLSFLIADYFFIEPVYYFFPISGLHVILFGLFLTVGVSISLLHSALEKKNAALAAALDSLEKAVQRSELAADHAKIGFHEYVAADKRQFWTPQMECLFGLAPGTFEGGHEDWLKRIHPEDRVRVEQERQNCIHHQVRDWKYEYRAVLPDGRLRWVEGRSRLDFSETGSLKQIIGASFDVTERRELEQRIERFAYIAAHDLRAPLRTISGVGDALLNRNRTLLDSESVRMLHMMTSSAERMKSLISDLLDFGSLGRDSNVAKANVDANAVFHLAVQEMAETIRRSNAVIQCTLLPVIYANEGELLRLFRNLLGNAIKYRGEGTPEIQVSASCLSAEWIFCVSDNGIGIDPKYHEQIFQTFERLHSASKYEGTGLGLAICKRIVERHGGRIWVESETGKGAQFYFALPVNADRSENSTPQAAGADASNRSSPSVLPMVQIARGLHS